MSVENEKPRQVDLRGVMVYPFSNPDKLIDFADERKGILVAINAEKILNANELTRSIINGNIGYCDGAGAVMSIRHKGAEADKLAGCELLLKFIGSFHASRTFYIIGGKPDVNTATVEKLRREYPGIRIVGQHHGYLGDTAERAALIDDVARVRPDFVFVAMGSPLQELLMADMLARHKAVYQGLGGSFDVYTGRVPRAPRWWIEHNMEFAYRLVRQPKRITRNIKYVKFAWWLATRQF